MDWPWSVYDPEKEKWKELGINYNDSIVDDDFKSERGKASLSRLGEQFGVDIERRTGFFKYENSEYKWFDTKEEAEAFVTKELSWEGKSSKVKDSLRSILRYLDWSGAEGRSAYDVSMMDLDVLRASSLETLPYLFLLIGLTASPYSILSIPAIMGGRFLHARYELKKIRKLGK